jgi:hypothetical protein
VSAGARSIAVLEKLMDEAKSEFVRGDSARYLAKLDGLEPDSRVVHQHQGLSPGLTIILSGSRPPAIAAPVIEASAEVVETSVGPITRARGPVRRIGTPVPHPSLARREAQASADQQPNSRSEGDEFE